MSAALMADLFAAVFGFGCFTGATVVLVLREATGRRPGLLKKDRQESGQ